MKTKSKTKVFQAVLAIIAGVVVGLSLADYISSYMEGGWRIATDITFAISGAMLAYVLVGPKEFLEEFRKQMEIHRLERERKIESGKRQLLRQREWLSDYPGLCDLAKKLYILMSINRIMAYSWTFFTVIFCPIGIAMLYAGYDGVATISSLVSLSIIISVILNDEKDTACILSETKRNERVLNYLVSIERSISNPTKKIDPYESYQGQISLEIERLPEFFFGPFTLIWMLIVFLWQSCPIIIAKTLYAVQSTMRLTVAISTLVGFATGWAYDYDRVFGCLAGVFLGLLAVAVSKVCLRFLPDPSLSIANYRAQNA